MSYLEMFKEADARHRAAALDPAEVARVLALPLIRLDRVLEVRVPGLPVTLWFVPGEVDADALLVDGISRGRIWTVKELQNWLDIGPTRVGTRYMVQVKLEFDALLVDIQVSGQRAWEQMAQGGDPEAAA